MEDKKNYFSRVMSSKPDDVLADIVGNVSGYDEEARLAAAWELEKRGKANAYTRSVEGAILERRGEKRPELTAVHAHAGASAVGSTFATSQALEEEVLYPFPTSNTLVLASGAKRFANFAIDYVVSLLFVAFVFFNLGVVLGLLGNNSFQQENPVIDNLLYFLLSLSYYFVCEHFLNGRTIGKMITRTRVLDEAGNKPSPEQIIGRTFARLIPFEAFSFLGDEARGWHDSLPGTIVIDEKKSVLKSDWV